MEKEQFRLQNQEYAGDIVASVVGTQLFLLYEGHGYEFKATECCTMRPSHLCDTPELPDSRMLPQSSSETCGCSGNFGNDWPSFLAPEDLTECLFSLMDGLGCVGVDWLGPGGFPGDMPRSWGKQGPPSLT